MKSKLYSDSKTTYDKNEPKQGRIVHRSDLNMKKIKQKIFTLIQKIIMCINYIFWQIFKEIV